MIYCHSCETTHVMLLMRNSPCKQCRVTLDKIVKTYSNLTHYLFLFVCLFEQFCFSLNTEKTIIEQTKDIITRADEKIQAMKNEDETKTELHNYIVYVVMKNDFVS